jgi:hypothetical protein
MQVIGLVWMHAHEPLFRGSTYGDGRQRLFDPPREAEVLRKAQAFRVKRVGTGHDGCSRAVEGEAGWVWDKVFSSRCIGHLYAPQQ